jgi:membrane-associated phospholipid phosphatase
MQSGLSLVLCTVAFSAKATDGIQQAGDALQFVLPGTAAALTLAHKDRQGAIEFGKSAALMLSLTYGLKYTVSERSPNGSGQSFPSAHTSISFSAAEFMRERYGWEYGIPAYAAASFVAYSRVESRQHHPQDVIAGAGIGIWSSFIFTKPYKGWQVRAEADGGYYGISFSRNW